MIKSRRRPEDKPVREAKRISLEARKFGSRKSVADLTHADRQKLQSLQTELRVIGAALRLECSQISHQLDERLQRKATCALATNAYRNTYATLSRAAVARNI